MYAVAILESTVNRPAPAAGRPGIDNRTRALDIVSFVARFYMAYIWIVAGLSKIFESTMTTTQTIQAYEIFTPQWSYYLAHLIGPLELAGGLLLLFGVFLRRSAMVGNIVLVLFIIGVGQAWLRGLELNCGCFTATEAVTNYELEYFQTILRDVFYIGLLTWTIYRPFKKWAVRP